jgi:hypothetical protein
MILPPFSGKRKRQARQSLSEHLLQRLLIQPGAVTYCGWGKG